MKDFFQISDFGQISISVETLALFVFLAVIAAICFFSKRLSQKEKRLQRQKMETIGYLAGSFAHDFNNILSGIRSAAELLDAQLPQNDKKRQYTGIILNACGASAEMIGGILNFTRKKQTKFIPFNLSQTAEETTELLQCFIREEIKVSCSKKQENLNICGCKDMIENLILNLAFNARDAISGKGNIEISTQSRLLKKEHLRKCLIKAPEGQYAELCVKDTGCGISKKTQKKIFTPFFTTKENCGCGFGLSNAYDTIKKHHGTLFLESSEKGTAFHIYLPQTKNPPQKTDERQKIPASILIVDDDPVLLELLHDILALLGASPIKASANEAMKAFGRAKKPDCAILDILMPGLGGIGLYKELRKHSPKLKIIFTSGKDADSELLQILKKDKATGFIRKPYTIDSCYGELQRLFKC